MTTDAALDQAIDHFLARVRAIRWLEPDAGMATLDADAQRFLDERADEHRAAVRAAGDLADNAPPVPDPASGHAVRVTRSLRDARDASAHAAGVRELREFSATAATWLAALERARDTALRRARAQWGAAACAQATERAWATVRALPGAGPAPGEPAVAPLPPGMQVGMPKDIAWGAPGGEAIVAHVWWLLAHGAAHADESPWAPLVALWERGTCPLATPEGTLLVYVPVRGDHGALVPEPDGTPASAKQSGGWTPPPYFNAGVEAWSTWGGGPKPPEPANARPALKRFNRVGLGPLPGMYEPPNMAWPGMTNWPGPPDLYIVRPPTAPIGAADIEQLVGRTEEPLAVPSVNRVPAPELFGDAPPREGVPWYRRLFRRGGGGGDNNP